MPKKTKVGGLSSLPSVDELLKGTEGQDLLSAYPRRLVVEAIRTVLEAERKAIQKGSVGDLLPDSVMRRVRQKTAILSSYSLIPLINATGIVVHTNLGRAPLSEKILKNVAATATGYSNLEYNLAEGARGQRHVHTMRLLVDLLGADDAFVVNNNAAAVLLCLTALAKDKEVIVSRGELVEIGGSFRVPDVMTSSGALLREVGTTNKTHLRDYARAIGDNSALILKVHQSNYKITGFTADVGISDLVSLGRKSSLPVMYDLGSGCLLDLKPYGIHSEPSAQEIIRAGADIVTFSGDKLLGGPQGGVIAGKKDLLDKIRRDPMARAVRVDKMTIAALEATLMEYMDIERATKEIPVLRMLLQKPEEIRVRANRIARRLRSHLKDADIEVISDISRAGGGALPDTDFSTYAVTVRPVQMTVNKLEEQLRRGSPPVIVRIKNNALLLDARTIGDHEVTSLVTAMKAAVGSD